MEAKRIKVDGISPDPVGIYMLAIVLAAFFFWGEPDLCDALKDYLAANTPTAEYTPKETTDAK